MTREEAIKEIKSWAIPSKNGRKVLETLIPELAESEDERARKWLLDYAIEMIAGLESDISLSTYDGIKGHDPEAEAELAQWRKARAYLEKQKDLDKMIVVSPEVWNNAISDAYENGKKEGEKQKEQKHYWKPTETDVALFNKAVTTNNTLTPAERANLDIIRSKFGCCHAINCSGIMQKEQKSKNELENAFKYYTDRGVTISCEDFEAEPKKEQKQEWSEEDKAFLKVAIAICNRYSHKDIADWLKSLRPQPKKELSIEKAIQWLDDTFYFLDNSSGRGPDYEITTHDFDSLEEMYDSFRKAVTVDSQPSWKPSEEQMEALKNSAYGSYQNGDGPILRELYEQLKKLI